MIVYDSTIDSITFVALALQSGLPAELQRLAVAVAAERQIAAERQTAAAP